MNRDDVTEKYRRTVKPYRATLPAHDPMTIRSKSFATRCFVFALRFENNHGADLEIDLQVQIQETPMQTFKRLPTALALVLGAFLISACAATVSEGPGVSNHVPTERTAGYFG